MHRNPILVYIYMAIFAVILVLIMLQQYGCEAPFCQDANGEWSQEACLDKPSGTVVIIDAPRLYCPVPEPIIPGKDLDDCLVPDAVQPDAGVGDGGTVGDDTGSDEVELPKVCKKVRLHWCRANRCVKRLAKFCDGKIE